MRIMPRRSTKASILAQAAEDEVEHAVSRKRIRVAEEMECCQAPVDTADAQVFSKVILELISALLSASVSASATSLVGN